MRLIALPYVLSVAKYDSLPSGMVGWYSLSVTESEISLVAETAKLPTGYVAREDGWRALKVEGTLDFSLVGILASISAALAERGIPIFVLSTYDTDVILVKGDRLRDATAALESKGVTTI